MAIGEVCNREVVIADRNLGVSEAAVLMRRYHVGDLVIVDEINGNRKPVGIITDRDIVLEVVAAGVNAEELKTGDIVCRELATVLESEGIWETIRHMRDKGVRRMPVVSAEGCLVGIVTLDDLVGLLAEEIGELARLIGREHEHEHSSRR